MTRYIALLRGINVGGHRKLKMADLRVMLSDMGLENVQTYIQSGNVVFEAPENDTDDLSQRIKRQIEKTFGYEVPVIICTVSNLKSILANIPFKKKKGWKRYITFLSHQPDKAQQEKLETRSSNIELFRVGDGVVYAHVDKQTDEKPLFSGSFIQKQLNIPATNRNLRTVTKLLKLAQSQ